MGIGNIFDAFKPPKVGGMLASAVLVLSVTFLAIFKDSLMSLVIILLVLWSALVFLDYNKEYLFISACAFILGFILPAIGVTLDLAEFADPTVLGIPLWLPFLLTIVVMVLVRVTNWLSDMV